MANIENELDFKNWLVAKPRAVAAALSSRVALRTIPMLAAGELNDYKFRAGLIPPVFRVAAASCAASRYKINEVFLHTASAGSVSNQPSAVAISFLAAAKIASEKNQDNLVREAVRVTQSAIKAIGDPDLIFRSINADVNAIGQGVKPSVLARTKLWYQEELRPNEFLPRKIDRDWTSLKTALNEADEDWDVWLTWYDNRLKAEQGLNRQLELYRVILSEDVALGNLRVSDKSRWQEAHRRHAADWEKGPAHMNALIKARIAGKIAATRSSKKPKEASATPTKPVAGSRSTEASRPQSTLAKAALANKVAILLQSKAIERVIDDRIAALESEAPRNDPDSIKTRETELEDLRKWKKTATALLGSLQTLIETGDEQKLVANAKAIREAITGLLGAGGKAVALDTTRAVVLAGFISTLCHLGLNLAEPMIGLAVAAGGTAIMGGSVVVEAFKAIVHVGNTSDAKSD